jgi:hypothetical protein
MIGGLAVNAYVEPVVSLDMDIVVAANNLDPLLMKLPLKYTVKRESHSVNIYPPDSKLRIQIQTDPRYQEFISRANSKTVLGYTMPVARLEDVLLGKTWVYLDAQRRPSKRQKDLADIMRIVETFPALSKLLPPEITERM